MEANVSGYHFERGRYWFRILGYGFYWKYVPKHPLLFSQRNGFAGKIIGNWYFSFLKPFKLKLKKATKKEIESNRCKQYDYVA